eukprot:sb/3468536/
MLVEIVAQSLDLGKRSNSDPDLPGKSFPTSISVNRAMSTANNIIKIFSIGSHSKGIDWSLNTADHSAPASAPVKDDLAPGAGTKGINWSLNSNPGQPPQYPGNHSNHYPGNHSNTQPPQYPSYEYPGPAHPHPQVEIPKNRAFPVMGSASCPECFDIGPHQATTCRVKTGFFSSVKEPAQVCRKCRKTCYFVRSIAVVPDDMIPSTNRPPPYTNSPRAVPRVSRVGDTVPGHGWPSPKDDSAHGWDPGDRSGHGWR